MKNIIFGEDHSDAITMRIFKNIAPRLKKLNYNVYFDELPHTMAVDDLIKMITEGIECFSLLRELGPLNYQEEKQLENGKAQLEFFAIFKKNDIDIQFIDPLEPCRELTMEEYTAAHLMRDEGMAKRYLESNSVFGRVGLEHVKGMQEYLIANQGLSEIRQTFDFFHIHSNIASDSHEKERMDMINSLPINLTILDGNELTDEQIVEHIISSIESIKEDALELDVTNNSQNSNDTATTYVTPATAGLFASTATLFSLPSNLSADVAFCHKDDAKPNHSMDTP